MNFRYNTYDKYLEAYTYMVRVMEPFSYNRSELLITVNSPDLQIQKRLNEIKDGPKPTYTLI